MRFRLNLETEREIPVQVKTHGGTRLSRRQKILWRLYSWFVENIVLLDRVVMLIL